MCKTCIFRARKKNNNNFFVVNNNYCKVIKLLSSFLYTQSGKDEKKKKKTQRCVKNMLTYKQEEKLTSARRQAKSWSSRLSLKSDTFI